MRSGLEVELWHGDIVSLGGPPKHGEAFILFIAITTSTSFFVLMGNLISLLSKSHKL